ncbi:MAG: chemoreceptor glutamine deamidase CheD [Methylococcaceae bacterium]|jgi:chemotaxis protein CheD
MTTLKLYHDRSFDIKAVKLLPGDYFASSDNIMIVTVLGSCVAACIRDKQTGIGGMNHFMLPEGASGTGAWGTSSARYGAYAMEMLINNVLKLGARRNQLEAKLFGGGAVIKHLKSSNIGEKNAKFSLEYLETEGIPVVSSDLLDIYPRRVYFFPQTGKVLVKKMYGVHNNEVILQEQGYSSSLKAKDVSGDIELFD